MKTRGHTSSEYKAALLAFAAGFVLAALALWKADNPELSAVAVLIGAVQLPLMAYGGMRTTKKCIHGEKQ